MFKFRIYIAGGALNCAQALADLRALCAGHTYRIGTRSKSWIYFENRSARRQTASSRHRP